MTRKPDTDNPVNRLSYSRMGLLVSALLLVSFGVFYVAMRVAFGGEERISNAIYDQFKQSQLAHAQHLASAMEGELNRVAATLETLSHTVEIRNGSTEECVAYLQQFIKSSSLPITTVSRTNKDQVFDCSNIETTVGLDGQQYPYLNDIFADPQHTPVVGRGIMSSWEPPELFTAIHVPYVRDGDFVGTLGSSIFFNQLGAILESDINLPDRSIIVLSDDNGDLLYHTDQSFVGKNVHAVNVGEAVLMNKELQDLFARRERGEYGVTTYVFDGEKEVASFAPIMTPAGRAWSVTIATPLTEIDPVVLPIVDRMQREIFVVAGSAFILLLTLLFVLVRWNGTLRDKVVFQTKQLRHKNRQLNQQLVERESEEEDMSVVLEQTRASEKEAKDSLKRLARTKRAMMNILEDVEEEKNKSVHLLQEMRKFKLAVENSSDMVVISDAKAMTLYVNSATEKISGYSSEEAVGVQCGALWGGHMDDAFYKDMWKTLNSKKVWCGEIRNKRKNGEFYDAFVTISPILNDKKEVIFFVDITRDITREKEIDRAKTEFVSLASHQLRTPLSSINWYTEMLMDGDAGALNDDQKDYLQQIYTGNQRMVDLVNALLNVSRIELGTFAITPETVDVATLAREALTDSKIQAKERSVTVKSSIARSIPRIQADSKLLRIIFDNLLSNAVKYTPEKGTVSLTLETKPSHSKKEKGRIVLTVKDTGMGIPKKQQDKIFTKLFRADNVVQTDTQGTGLGLYIIKSILDHTGGKISFKSVENKGTTFVVELPLSGMKEKKGTRELS